MTTSIRVRVHEPGDKRLDGILRLITRAGEAGESQPLADVLAALCREIAGITGAPVVSVYLVDHEREELFLAGNVGFPDGTVGRVRLKNGEGLTGFVAECLRPVSVAIGRHDERYKHVPGIGEEQFPAYLGVPVLGGGGALGVLVVQRREAREIPLAEVALAAALAAPVAYAVERAQARAVARDAERNGVPSAPVPRTARLLGRALAPGMALGRADVLPSLSGIEVRGEPRPGHAVALALAGLARELMRARKQVEAAGLAADALVRLRAMTLLLEDLRFRDLCMSQCRELGAPRGLAAVAREYARALGRPETDAWLRERAHEVEDLCLLVGARAAKRGLLTGGGVLVADRLSGIMALAAVARRAVGVAVVGPAEESAFGASLLAAAGIPVVAEVGGLFAWVRLEDRVLVDGDAGVVRVNPPATAVARLRSR